MKKKVGLLLAIASIFVLIFGFAVFAVDKSDAVSGASLTVGTSGRITASVPASTSAQGGNVTFVNVTTTRSTVKWAGFLGRVSSTLSLGLSGDTLYSFGSGNVSQVKTVFAAPDSSFDFSSLLNASPIDMDTAWGFPTGHVDSATRTLTLSGLTIAQVSNLKAVGLNAYDTLDGTVTNGTLRTDIYNSSLFADTAAPVNEIDFAFGVKVVPTQRDFGNRSVVDYELVVPVNASGLAGAGIQTYYFFLDVE